MSERLSIIIPVYNEINHVRSLIKQLRLKSKNRNEIIFVDGNSNDGTKEFLDKSKDVVVVNSKKSRSIQMNTGAGIASNKWLYFLHVDSILPNHFDSFLLKNSMNKNILKCFQLKFDKNNFLLNIASYGTKYNIAWCRGGDQSVFINKSFFEQLGKFDERYLIAEDLVMFRKAYKYGKVIILPEKIITSSRKFLENGIFRTQLHHIIIRFLIFLDFSPNKINSYAARIKNK